MKKLSIFVSATLLISSLSFATIRRVGYNGLARAGVDFSTFDAANTASAAGDTIQMYGSNGGGTVTKRLVIIGFGFNFDKHPGLQAANLSSDIGTLFFGAGSDGSYTTGVSGSFYVRGDINGNHTPISNITFNRCYGTFYTQNYSGYGPINNITITSSVITGGGMQYNSDADYPVSNLSVFNCIIYGFTLYKTGTSAVFINCVAPSPDIVGNYALALNDAGALVKNSIIPDFGTGNINTIFENNFFRVAQPTVLPPGTNNRWGQDWTVLFNRITTINNNASYYGYGDFDENYFVLKAASPAINGGFDGNNAPTNCGIFGGEPAFVYRPSGVPAIPTVYKLTAPGLNASSNPYNVTVSVKSNN